MEVTYTLTPEDYFRAGLFSWRNLFRFQPLVAGVFVFMVLLIAASLMTFFWVCETYGFYRHGLGADLWMVTRSMGIALCVGVPIPCTILYFAFRQSAGQRTLHIDAEGLVWQTPVRGASVRWQEMYWPQDDGVVIYLPLRRHKTMSGTVQSIWKAHSFNLVILPRSAFALPAEAERFLTTAQAYWNAARNGTPLPAEVHDDRTWPPAPRTL